MATNSQILSQNFIAKSSLIEKLIKKTSITDTDTVIDIGAGKGAITKVLVKEAHEVYAVEVDTRLIGLLHSLFDENPLVHIIERDIVRYDLPRKPYKVFANIPFGKTADIIKKLLDAENPPLDAYVIVQKEAAEKFSGNPKETLFSLLHKPVFSFESIHTFSPYDFSPVPKVTCVMLHIHKRNKPELTRRDYQLYATFVTYAFTAWKKDLKVAFDTIFSYAQWKKMTKEMHLPLHPVPSEVTYEQWKVLFMKYIQKFPNGRI